MSSEPETVRAVDLFCGAGGLSTGLALACEDLDRDVELAAVNHWDTAIDTHEKNHPWATHYRTGIDQIKPIEVFPEGDIDLLIAAPSCTHHSNARGGKPVSAQKRMAPFSVLDWIAQLNPKAVLIENVKEFRDWGPVVDGQPTGSGKFFEAWTDAVEDGLGYSLSHRVLTAADYGDPTTRERLFVIARRDDHPVWPPRTHADSPGEDDDVEPWRTAREIIDWSNRGESIWERGITNSKKPLVENTMGRIAEGIRKYADDALLPFADAVAELDRSTVEDLQADVVDVEDLPEAVEERDRPFLVRGAAQQVATDGGELTGALCPPTVKGQHGGSVPRNVDESPVATVATSGALQLYTPEPYFVPYMSERAGQRPRTHDLKSPFPTVTATGSDPYLAEPYLVEYYQNGKAQPVDEPAPTVTTRDRFALIHPELYPWGLDIRYRMLSPSELAAAQGFPDDYEFAGGTKKAIKKQIGNAVPVNLATALCRTILADNAPTLESFTSHPAAAESDD